MDESRARALLRAERAEVATLLRQTEQEASEDEQVQDIPLDFGDAGLPLTEEANDEAVADQLRARLDAIDRALARLEAGTYGRSVLSGKPIPDERLEADPAAELTIDEARLGAAAVVSEPDGYLRAGVEAELSHHVGDVPGDGGRADDERGRDGLIAPPVGDEFRDL
jgi:DnaK suppressor protein